MCQQHSFSPCKLNLISLDFKYYSGQWSSGHPVPLPVGALLEDEDLSPPYIVADKSDLFIAYATVPGYMYSALSFIVTRNKTYT